MIEGRPAGVQIIGRRFREDLILDAMQKIEDRVGVLTEQLWNRAGDDMRRKAPFFTRETNHPPFKKQQRCLILED
ncbi:MAG: hypothetical protein CM15mP45_06500 [Deltaproteobacteria bacterium]|nr:MAG: hypothetical protein CM15mP45_06500 [Deltaproteobacteria bacterium]